MARKKRLLKYTILLSITLLSVILMVSNIFLNRINYVKIPEDNEKLGIKEDDIEQDSKNNSDLLTEEGPKKSTKEDEVEKENASEYNFNGQVFNIVLLGGDRRYDKDIAHTDSIIILSIDPVHKKIKVSSIMRDTYLNVYGHGKTKITHAYVYGGAQLTIRTLNENFNLKIKDYAFVDFTGFEKLIDLVGGVEVDVKQNEINEINKYINEVASIKKVRAKLLRKPGTQTLNGQQALAYCRIRKAGNNDYQRTERQRQVLDCIINKISTSGSLKFSYYAVSILPYIETSMSKTEILQMGMKVLSSDFSAVEQQRFPMDGYCKGKTIDGVWYLVPNIEATRKQLHQFIYGDMEQKT